MGYAEMLRTLPSCGLCHEIDENPENEAWVDDDGEELAMCRYCGDWDPEERYIEMRVDGKIEMCCEECFWAFVEDGYYEDAVFVLEHRIGGALDKVDCCALIAELKEAYKWKLMFDGTMAKIHRIKRGA